MVGTLIRFFGNAANVGAKLMALIKSSSPQVILLDCSAITGFEFTALKMLIEAEERLRAEGTEVWLAALNPETRELIQHTPLAERLGHERMFHNLEQAIAAFEAREPAPSQS